MKKNKTQPVKIFLATIFALIAFAANSIFCRLALKNDNIDPVGFTILRLFSGAIVLLLIAIISGNFKKRPIKLHYFPGVMLFVYALTFSLAYITLDTGTGALILFGSVQITMLIIALVKGNRLHLLEWLGLLIAFLGFIYIVLPTISSPSFVGFLLMMISGIAWGIYTILGKNSNNPVLDTTYNFGITLPMLCVVGLLFFNNITMSPKGILLSIMSGGIASGIGYSIWYFALRDLTVTLAAVVQLSVPIIAALGGFLFISESIHLRFIISTILVLGGILLVVIGKNKNS
ncbi:MAG: DMT family transporter [Leptospirales bacterium]